jgi:outer membrane protein OmpA-like peptidoglycan-associated protein
MSLNRYKFAKYAFASAVALSVLVSTAPAQQTASASPGDSFWIDFWSKPRPAIFGAEEDAFNQNMKEVFFASNDDDKPSNPAALEDNVRWLKDHPNVRFFIDGYASKRGSTDYNLSLSKRRADWAKRQLIARGIPENRIVLAVGWGELYPTCVGDDLDCRAKNRLVRFTYIRN